MNSIISPAFTRFVLILFVSSLFSIQVKSQDQLSLPSDTLKLFQTIERFRPNEVYLGLLRMHDPLLYVSFLHRYTASNRSMPLLDGEGKDGYWLEGNIAHRVPIYRGKPWSPGILKKLRWTFDANFLIRMTRDSSSPLLPGNNTFGTGIDYLLTPLLKIEKKKPVVWLKLQAHHYSNGQQDAFFLSADPLRNNYKRGDFSTNYLRALVQIAAKGTKESWTSLGLGVQRDGNFLGPFKFSDEMKSYYGQNRLIGTVQYSRMGYHIVDDANTGGGESQTEFGIRGDFEYITDDVSRYVGDKKYRASAHVYAYWFPFVSSNLGVVIHSYTGRDYLNIRFGEAINVQQFGLILKM
jgi:hypothetical protein